MSREHRVLAATAAAVAALHLLTAVDSYGVFRDELYYLSCARRLAWGYVDHPPLTPFLARITSGTLGDSQLAMRFLPALASGFAVLVTGRLAGVLGGGVLAQIAAALSTALCPIFVGVFGYLSMNAFDVCVWVGSAWMMARILERARPRDWLGLGALLGVGLLNKLSPVFLGFGLTVGLIAARRWDLLRTRWPWLAASLAIAIMMPHLVWQVAHGWPTAEFIENATTGKNVQLSPLQFVAEQSTLLGPGCLPLALLGLWFLSGSRAGQEWRALGWAVWAVVALLALQGGKPYYLSPAYPIVLAAGAVVLERLASTALRRRLVIAYVLAMVMIGLVLVPLSKPVLSIPSYLAYAERLGIEASSDERHALGRLPQFFADRLGWHSLARSVADVHASLSSEDRAVACVFAQNYGQAGAIEHYAEDFSLPPVISGHNNWHLWGPDDCSGEILIVIGDDRATLESVFDHVDLAATHSCPDCMPYERNKPIWIARSPRIALPDLWPRTKHFD